MTRRRRVGTSACRLFFAAMDGRRRRRSLGRARRERASGERGEGVGRVVGRVDGHDEDDDADPRAGVCGRDDERRGEGAATRFVSSG